jgi:SAM-dependent methyltransferase
MAQYQSFPDIVGDSRTLEKLKALHLPALAGKRFLDIGCNEGFFCGYALFDGAARAVGIDHSAGFIDRARRRFPDGEFLNQDWNHLPEGPFDVILLASALHYADDQPALIGALVERLTPDGILVLELGIASSKSLEWVKVERGIDERYFPTMPLLRQLLEDFAWKWMGPSVAQAGDPVARHVIHISRRRPLAYLLMQPPAFGKTSISNGLFGRAGVPVVSGDDIVADVARGRQQAPDALRALLVKDYSPFHIDETMRQVFRQGLGPQLVEIWIEAGGKQDFALDAYVPSERHAEVAEQMRVAGYMPITLHWNRVGAGLTPAHHAAGQAEAFFRSIAAAAGELQDGEANRPVGFLPQGFIDDASVAGGALLVRGWAVDGDGRLPQSLQVSFGGRVYSVDDFESQERPDVQRHLGLEHAQCGYLARIGLVVGPGDSADLAGLEVRVGDDKGKLGPALPMAGPLAQRLRREGR